jgi:hypothetical protein
MSTPGYIHPEVKVDQSELVDAVNANVAELIPNWRPIPFSLEQRIIAGLAGEFATGLQLITGLGAAITAAQGRLAKIDQDLARPATGTVTVVVADADGHTLPAGAGLQGTATDGSVIPLELAVDAVIPPGETSVSGVQVQVAFDGELGNGVTGTLLPDDAVVWLTSVTLEEPTSQGADEEDDDDFLERLASRLELLADAQILPDNIERLVRDVPGVGRACVLNLIDPANPDEDTPGHITISPLSESGTLISQGTRDALALLLARVRVLNNVNHIVDPTINDVTIALTVAAWPEFLDQAADDARTQLLAWLSPTTWGMPQYDGDGQEWRLTRHVRVAELAAKVSRAESIAYPLLATVLINGQPADLEMTGLVPLPRVVAEDIDVTVVEREP